MKCFISGALTAYVLLSHSQFVLWENVLFSLTAPTFYVELTLTLKSL